MSTQLVRLAAAVLSSEKGRKTVGWVLAAILSPVILLTAFLCCVGSGTAEHNSAVVSAAFYGTELSASVPEEYRMQLTQMRGSFSHLDAAVAEVNQKAEGNRLDPIQVKAVFFALCFGADTLSQTDAEAFVACFCETETRGREETGETYGRSLCAVIRVAGPCGHGGGTLQCREDLFHGHGQRGRRYL